MRVNRDRFYFELSGGKPWRCEFVHGRTSTGAWTVLYRFGPFFFQVALIGRASEVAEEPQP